MKKYLSIAIVVIIGLMGVVALLTSKGGLKNKKRPGVSSVSSGNQTLREIPADELPVVRLIPRADKREVTLEIENLKNVNSFEYELTYLANDLPRGVVGTINLEGQTKITRKILLGTCSKNVCKYDEGVKGGTLTLRLRRSDGVIKATAPFDLDSKDYQLQLQGILIQ